MWVWWWLLAVAGAEELIRCYSGVSKKPGNLDADAQLSLPVHKICLLIENLDGSKQRMGSGQVKASVKDACVEGEEALTLKESPYGIENTLLAHQGGVVKMCGCMTDKCNGASHKAVSVLLVATVLIFLYA